MCWNTLVSFTIELFNNYDVDKETFTSNFKITSSYPKVLKKGIKTIQRVIENVSWMKMGDSRANVIEPQLGYILRGFEMALQEGKGVGHGLVAILEIKK